MNTQKHTPGYEITKDGQVFSCSHNWRGYGRRELTAYPNKYGYLLVRLTIENARKSFLVHKLVAAKFLPERPSLKHQLRHLDGNKLNNSANNLKWGTAKDNADDREKHGRTSRGINHSARIKDGLERIGYHVNW